MTAVPDLTDQPVADHLLVVGSGSTVVRLADELERAGEEIVVVLPATGDAELAAELRTYGADVVSVGRVTEAVLTEVGVARAKAAVIIDDDDVQVIRIALAIEELNPGLRLVLGLSDPRLGARLRPVLGETEILSTAELAAPSLVAAALAMTDTMTFELGGRLVVAGPRAMVGGEELALIGDSTKTSREDAVLPADGDIILGTELTGRKNSAVRQSGRVGALARVFDHRLRLVLLGLLILIVLSTVYFKVVGMGWLEALYLAFTASTDTGIGGEEDELGVGFRFGAVVIQLFGLILSSGITAVIVDALISSRLDELSGGVRGRPRDHIVVCGLGRVGSEVALRLRARGIAVVGIEHDEGAVGVRRARRAKIPVVIGPAGEDAVLEAAGAGRADAVLALTDQDSVNLEISLIAKQLNESVRVVTRVYDDDLALRVERRLDLGATRSVSMLAAPAFASAALGKRRRMIFPIGRWVLIFTELTIQPDSSAIGLRCSELVDPEVGRILAIQRADDEDWLWDEADHRLAAGDQLAVAATRAALAKMILLTQYGDRS